MCNWVTLLYKRKLTRHCKPGIMEKNHYIYIKKNKNSSLGWIIFLLMSIDKPDILRGQNDKVKSARNGKLFCVLL